MAGHRGGQEVVTDALRAEDPTHRATALGAAARLKILSDELLIGGLNDPSDIVRRRAAELAPRIDNTRRTGANPAIVAALVALLDDPACAEVAAHALGELPQLLDTTSPAAVVESLEHQAGDHDDPLCREAAVAALGSLGQGLATVLAATDDVATVRRRAVIALANFDGPEVDAALAKAVDDRDWQVRQAAEDLLA